MGLFWKRKSGDQFVSLKLNEPLPEKTGSNARESAETNGSEVDSRIPVTKTATAPQGVTPSAAPTLEPVPTGGAPMPIPSETNASRQPSAERWREVQTNKVETTRSATLQQKPVASAPSRSPFATSVLGLNLSMEELQAQEAALEQEFSARFRRAVSATRESLSERLDTVFQGLKQIDENLLEELEEALIAADIGVVTTQQLLETVRRGIARKQINDLDALKAAIKDELLKILRQSEKQGVASETSVAANVSPYVMMIVGVNGVGKTTTIGKLAQRIKAEGNDVLICAADTFRAAPRWIGQLSDNPGITRCAQVRSYLHAETRVARIPLSSVSTNGRF